MMKKLLGLFLTLSWLTVPALTDSAQAFASAPPASTGYLITNDDIGSRAASDTATFYTIGADGTLSNPVRVTVGGAGTAGGYFAANRVAVLNNPNSPCAYFSQGTSNTIIGVQGLTQSVVGSFSGSGTDSGTENGIGMVVNGSYLYANFSGSATIATFAVQPGCALQFISDISPVGLNGGTPKGMALYGDLMIVTYGDGSIQSFDISGGAPIANEDEQNSTGYSSDDFPDGVVITADGHYAIFGDDSSDAAVEVSDISSGQLTTTALYNLPSGFNSNNVLLSPDETLLYVVNNTSGQVSAAFFDAYTGAISGSCISAQLNGFDSSFSFLSSPVTQLPVGTGAVLYVAEMGQPSAIGVINISSSGGQCALTEAAQSPVADANSQALLSIGVVQNITQAGLYSPASGAALASNSAVFQWYGAPADTAFWIDVGSTPGGNNYYSSGSLPITTLSATVNSLPTDGSTVYVTFYSLVSGSWTSLAYTFTAFNAGAAAGVLTTPTPGSTLSGSVVTFGWSAGSNATAYWLDVGSTAGGNNYYSSGNLGNVLTTTVNSLPTNGSAVYVTLYSFTGSQWTANAYAYTAFNLAAAVGVVTTPPPGSILTGSTVTFQWSAGSGASAYWMDVGSTPSGNNYYSSGNLGNVLTTTVNSLPTDGSAVDVTLYSFVGGQWTANAYTYTAFNANAGLAVMRTPASGSTLSGTTGTFTWNADANATAYWVDISVVGPGGNDLDSSGNLGNVLTETVYNLPATTPPTTIYVTLYSFVGGQWSSTASTYNSGP